MPTDQPTDPIFEVKMTVTKQICERRLVLCQNKLLANSFFQRKLLAL